MLNELKEHINDNLSFLKGGKLLVAVSGGIDSVVLAHLSQILGLNFALAHCNFNLRGEESDADEEFVLQLAEDLELEVFIENFDTLKYAADNKCSIQMAARELRYNWFEELANQLNYDFILTAHHADDNLETFLINFTRGTGLEGLTGIPEVNAKFVRPLLPFSSNDIQEYAKENKIKWRDDSSNKSTKYVRNKLRHEVIPILKEINPSLLQSFQSTLNNLNDTSIIVNESIDGFLNKAIDYIDENNVTFNIDAFKKLNNPKPYLYESLKEFGFTQWDDILNLLDAETSKQVFSSTYRLIKNREHLLLSKISVDDFENISISENDKTIETPIGSLFFDEADAIFGTRTNVIFVDKDVVKYPLKIRKWREGDVFYPLGMTGKKKISKFFKDEKLSLLDKENTLLLCSAEDIIWVINRRADNRFRVTENTKHILKVELKA
ncbi:MAG: tRNA lysidine(34) synthetase TilS [Flaviramulus sp.]|nr:tRNA lysidine(34) synthetase TilS [Flaviramulus sp.]NNC51004.1 tRNA lysidine(34) synthetase TilS [Flaviramulus sp.]